MNEDTTPVDTNSSEKALWNPVATVNWSVFLFTPIFGAWILAKNWSSLGEDDLAKKARYWALGGLIPLILTVLYIPYVIVWYFLSARPQVKYFKENIGTDYTKKAWKKPIKIVAIPWIILLIILATQSSEEESYDYAADIQHNLLEGSNSPGESKNMEELKEIIHRIDRKYTPRTFTILQILPYENKALVYYGEQIYMLHSKNLKGCVDDQQIRRTVRWGENEMYETAAGGTKTVRTFIEISDAEIEPYKEAKGRIDEIEKKERKLAEEKRKEEQRLAEEKRLAEQLALVANGGNNEMVKEFSPKAFNISSSDLPESVKPNRQDLETKEEYEDRLKQWKEQTEQERSNYFEQLGIPLNKHTFMITPFGSLKITKRMSGIKLQSFPVTVVFL